MGIFKDYFGMELKVGDSVVYPSDRCGGVQLRHGSLASFVSEDYGGIVEVVYAAVTDIDSDDHQSDMVMGYNTVKV